jgi:SH3 domain-containing YSC84-like protein 1
LLFKVGLHRSILYGSVVESWLYPFSGVRDQVLHSVPLTRETQGAQGILASAEVCGILHPWHRIAGFIPRGTKVVQNIYGGDHMKRVWLGVVLLAVSALPAFGQDKEQDRVENAGKVVQEILNIPDNIPQAVIDKADCVVVLPSVLKLAIGFGGSYGRGVMTCRRGKEFQGSWGAPTMMALEGGSFGFQLGGQATDFVLLLMTSRSADNILTSKVKLGGDASAAAGPVGRNASAETDVTLRAEILSYSRARGLFAGVSLEGSTLRPDNDANKNLYGKEVSAKDIVFMGAVGAPPSAHLLLTTLNKKSPKNKSKN